MGAPLHSLTVHEKLDIAAVILKGDEFHYFDENIIGQFPAYFEIKQYACARFNNRVIQEGVNTYFQSIRLEQFVTDDVGHNDARIKPL